MTDNTNKSRFALQAFLFLVFGALCVLLYVFLTKNNHNISTSVSISRGLDSASITRWDVIPHGDVSGTYNVFKDSSVWKIRLKDHTIVDADLAIVGRSLKHLSKMNNAERVNLDKSKWKAEGIDDNGTRVVVYEAEKIAGTYIIGKLEFVDQYKSSYYFRPVNSDSVYLIKEAYLDASVIAPELNFRKRRMAPIDPYFYKTVTVISADTNVFYLLENIKGKWSMDGRDIDQNKVRAYIKMLSLIQVPEFAAEKVKNHPEASVTIDTQYGPITLTASREQNGRWVMASSVNIGNRLELNDLQVNAVFPPFGYFRHN